MSRRWLFVIPAIFVFAALTRSEKPRADSWSATYSNGVLRVTIPNVGPREHTKLIVELLSPEDELLARAEAGSTPAVWDGELRLGKAMPVEDIVWQRLRVRSGDLVQTESVSRILRRPVLQIIGQQQYLAGGAAAVRAIVTDTNGQPVAGRMKVELLAEGKGPILFSGPVNQRGAAEAQFRLPAGLVGSYQLHYVADTGIGQAQFTQPIRIQDKVRILLTTEKPVYQPGQTIHVRALALDRADHRAAGGRGITFEVEDSKGNKVFKRAARTDEYGIAAAEFGLADEVNLGTYHLCALMDGGNNAELALRVDRYVLPKFKVAVELTGKSRHGYRPGDRVTGVVRSNYIFGKAVEGEAEVKLSAMDVLQFEAGSARGKTDAQGEYRFDLQLPDYFAGRQGAARVLVEATVKDSAGHSEQRGEPIVVSASPILLTAIPESGALVPNLENQVYVVASYADGKPAVAKVTAAGQTVTTDEAGVAAIRISAGRQERQLRIDAEDREGNTATATVPLNVRAGDEQVLLRADRAVYRAGDVMTLKVLSTRQAGAVYLDVVKDRQTVLTRDVDLVNGRAQLTLTCTPDLAGTLDLNAYVIGRDSRPVTDHRLVFVQPAGELKVEATANAPVYRPGEDARVDFRVTNGRGEGVQAAIGVQVVDEAVFALAEQQPGFAKVFFYLEQEVMKPRYEIHSFGMSQVVETGAAAREQAARALFAATEMVNANRFETVVGRELPLAKSMEYRGRYLKRMIADVNRLGTSATIPDAWGTSVRIQQLSYAPTVREVRSAGPDKEFNTSDDVFQNVYVRQPVKSEIAMQVENDRGPNNGRVEIAGSVVDGGGPLGDARVTAGNRTARTGVDGRFTISALPPGTYRIEVSSPGMQTVARQVTLQARDRAVVTAKLGTGAVTETVTVMADAVAAPRVMMMRVGGNVGVVGGVPGGIAGGAPGGVLGGIIGGVPSVAPASPLPMAKMVAPRLEAPAGVRVRSYFPEALYIHPALITDGAGRATLSIPLADSITTWRMALTASTVRGALGSGTGAIKVFQDFFADLDLPVTLTQGDRVSIPVAVYNYSGKSGDVSLKLERSDWFALVDDTVEKSLAVESGRVGGAQFTVEGKRIGKFKLTLSARMKDRADIVVREVEVVPDGREQTVAFNGRLEKTVAHDVAFPPNAVPEAGKIFVRLYPGPLSQVVEGMDAILRMPFGCFEQTSSATYPNVLALDYMKRTKKLTPEIRAKAEGFIATGYQRLLTYEVPGGGFSWFGNPPANKILTAYGLMEFGDMSKVYDVDSRVMQRTQEWLASQQQGDGSWRPDEGGIREGAINRYVNDTLRMTAYLGWALENTGYRGPALAKARRYVEANRSGNADPYTVAVVANFAVESKDEAFAHEAVQRLLNARIEKDDQAWWTSEETGMYGRGASAAVETTGLAVQALLKSGEAPGVARKALAYLASKKDASGTWGTTQATIMALRAILFSTEKGAADVRGTVEITLNGRPAGTLALTPDNNDLYHQIALKGIEDRASNRVELRFSGQGSFAYQVAGRYFVPWTARPANEPLTIDVQYDRTRLAQDDVATATATVRSHLPRSADMVMVDLGIPPGFDLLSEDLQDMQARTASQKGGRLEKFSLTATQAILYFDGIPAGGTVTVKYRLRAKYPIRARTFRSRVYEYYDPGVSAVARPVPLEVEKRK
jgi:uncharacterized protein YfaS (alpha-2-macroglobulin family)